MKHITLTRTQQTVVKSVYEIERVVHNIPAWIYPWTYGGLGKEYKCPVCNSQIEEQTGHGTFITECSVIDVKGFGVMPIHTPCYQKLIGTKE